MFECRAKYLQNFWNRNMENIFQNLGKFVRFKKQMGLVRDVGVGNFPTSWYVILGPELYGNLNTSDLILMPIQCSEYAIWVIRILMQNNFCVGVGKASSVIF